MAAPPSGFEGFLAELTATRGVRGKVRLLARHWRQIERLPPAERQKVALALGSRFAWERLERRFSRDGSLSDGELLVKRVLGRIGSADAEELHEVAAEVRRGDRSALEDRLFEEVEQALEEEARERQDPAPPPMVPEPPDDDSLREKGTGELLVPPPPVPPAPPDDPDRLQEGAAVEVSVPAASPADDAARRLVGEESPLREEDDDPAEAPEESSMPPEPAPEPRPEVEPAARELEIEAGAPTAEREAGPRRAPLLPSRRLRILRALDRGDWESGWLQPEGRARLISRLGPGWAARRAVSEMIRQRAPEDLAEALALVAGLATPMEQAWCLGDLLAHWELDDEDRRRVVEAAPTPAMRRRLARRAAGERR